MRKMTQELVKLTRNTQFDDTEVAPVKITKKQIYGLSVQGYRDGSDWTVKSAGERAQSFNTNKWSLKAAMEFYARIITQS